MLASFDEEDSLFAAWDISTDKDLVEDEFVTSGHVVNMDMIPDTGTISYDGDLAKFESCANQYRNMTKLVKRAGADSVDGGHHQNVSFHSKLESNLRYNNIRGTLGIWNNNVSLL
jgi:hypothetical protein